MSKCITVEDLGLQREHFIKEVRGYSVYLKAYSHNLSLDTKVFRYMKLSTLLDMLFYSILHVSNRESFSDLREKKGLNDIAEKLSSFAPVPSYMDKLRLRKAEKDKSRALSVCVSCWTLDNREGETNDESFLMWKAYSNDETICRVGTTIGQLINCIKKTPADIVISDVDYNGQKDMNSYENLIYRKSIFYKDEQEVRMAVLSNNRNGINLTIDNSVLLREIKISPFIPPVHAYFVLKGLKEFCKRCTDVKIEYSKVMESLVSLKIV